MDQKAIVAGSDWRDGFLFVGNHLALDFVNTRPVQNGEPQELLTDFSGLLRWFQAADLISGRDAARLQQQWGDSARARQTVERMRELRERLRKEILRWEDGGEIHQPMVDEINKLLAAHPMRARLSKGAGGAETETWFEINNPEDLFAPLASSTADLFAHADRSRVRKCDNCVLLFHDTSKKGTRRWCSMQMCGNRFKVAAYAARNRGHEST